ncbi:MAG: sigma-54-dependent Fis family transcriptional regulator [Firmicutes bacterium]|nr:sigma-54-dependent Fis family transcriptional regulator [Bacillota bacterium]
MKPGILIVDDEKSICTFLELALEDDYEVTSAVDTEGTLKIMQTQQINVVLLDLNLGTESGMDLLSLLKKEYPETAVIMMTAYGDIRTSVEAVKRGAANYLCKPVVMEELKIYIEQALQMQHLSRRVENLTSEVEELEQRSYYGDIIGKSEPMQRVYKLIDRVKDADVSIMISGESGTGKELVARAIHKGGSRKNENFESINCAAIPEGLLEEELFGHVKGSFTSAYADKKGKFELADRGTLFLDEIGDMPLALQGKLLRVLQEKEVMPVGGTAAKQVDVRVICATNKDLPGMIEEGLFRRDLYYRLHVVEIHIPPLRERRQDIPDLCRVILDRINTGKETPSRLSRAAEKMLLQYSYPGNVRELINMLEYARIMASGEVIEPADLPVELETGRDLKGSEMTAARAVKRYLSQMTIKDVERLMIINAVEENPQNKKAAARQLGISERTLFYKLSEYGL